MTTQKIFTLNIEWDCSQISPSGDSIECQTLSEALTEAKTHGFNVWGFEEEDSVLSSENKEKDMRAWIFL